MRDKNKNKLMRESFLCFVDYKTTFSCKKHFNKQHQPDILFKEKQFLVLKGVKRKLVNGSLVE